LPAYLIPSAFISLDELPLSQNGKVDRKALPASHTEVVSSAQTTVSPRSETEQVLTRIWRELLGRGDVGGHDNFFSIGGHSLKATQVLAHIRDEFGVELSMRTFFESPKIADLANAIEKRGDDNPVRQTGSLVEIQAGGTKPPLFLVHGAGG